MSDRLQNPGKEPIPCQWEELIDEHLIKHPPQEMLQDALEWALREFS